MTTYNLNLTLNEGPSSPSRPAAVRVLANLISDEPEVMAATLRAVADRLDPPKPVHRFDPHGQNVIHRPRGPIDFDAPEVRGSVVRATGRHPEHPEHPE